MTGEFSSKATDTGGTFAKIKGLPTYNSIPRIVSFKSKREIKILSDKEK